MNIVQLFHATVVRSPQHPCMLVKQDGRYISLSYQEVWDQITRFSAALRNCGVQPGNKVAIMAETSAKWAVCDLAIMSLGAVTVPIYPSASNDDIQFILHNTDVRLFITDEIDKIKSISVLFPPQIEHCVVLHPMQSTRPAFVSTFDDFVNSVQEESLDMLLRIDVDQIATIVHTSGTSGRPKGVMLSHQNLVSNIRSCLSVLPVHPSDVMLSYLPLSHIFERTVGHFSMFVAGGTIAYAESLETIQQNLQEVRPTLLVTVPRLLEKVYTGINVRMEKTSRPIASILQKSVKQPYGFKRIVANQLIYKKLKQGLGGRLRAVVSGGAGLSPEVASFYQNAGIPVCEGYGMTEASPVISVNPIEDIRPGTVGKPLPGVSVRIAEDGELLVKGPNVMHGYYGNIEATTEALDTDGWLHTGDVAELIDGYIRIVERKKHLLVLATGKNVAPYPIENALALSPYITDAVVIGDGRKYVSCLIVPDFLALREKALAYGLKEGDYTAWTNNISLRRLLQAEIQQRLAPFADFERPKRALIMAHPFTIESGELTATQKVKTKAILKTYQPQIDLMYEGLSYLDIYGDPETGMGDVTTLGTTSAVHEDNEIQHQVTKRHYVRWLAIAAGALILVGGGAEAMQHTKQLQHLNLLSTVRHVHRNNNQINKENVGIVKGMSSVNQLSSLTPIMASQLQGLDTGLATQNENLKQLTSLSEQEISLSKQFGSVANALHQSISGISYSTNQQNESITKMSLVAGQLASEAQQLEKTNQDIAGKLNQATGKTKTISSEVP